MDELSEEEKAKVIELQGLCHEIDEFQKGKKWLVTCGQETYIRYLKGHGWNVQRALKKMRNTAEWRWSIDADKFIDTWENDESKASILVKAHWPSAYCGKDHDGRPVNLVALTGVDFPGLLREAGIDYVLKHVVYLQEKALRANPSGQNVLILDFGLDSMAVSTLSAIRALIQSFVLFMKKASSVLDPHYPESNHSIYFTRMPRMFRATWKVTKPFLHANTVAKIEILREKPKERLLKSMPEDVIPDFLGGKARLTMGLGGSIPKGALLDDDFMTQMAAHNRILLGKAPDGGGERFSLSRSPAQEQELQEQMAVELLQHQVAEMKRQSVGAHKRGSWNFVPELEWLENADEETIRQQLKENAFDTEKALEGLRKLALQEEQEAESAGATSASAKGEDEESGCFIM